MEGDALSGVPGEVPRVFRAAVVAVGRVKNRRLSASRQHEADNDDGGADSHARAILGDACGGEQPMIERRSDGEHLGNARGA